MFLLRSFWISTTPRNFIFNTELSVISDTVKHIDALAIEHDVWLTWEDNDENSKKHIFHPKRIFLVD